MARPKSTSGSRTSRAASTNPTDGQASNNELTNPAAPASVAAGSVVSAGTTPAENMAAEVKSAPEPRKLEVVKNEPRKSVVVPIKMEEEIRRRAYEIFMERGSRPGSEAEDWLTAERELRQRYQKQHSA